MKKKSLALLLAIAIVVVGVVAGTLAWLTDKTAPVTNTFTTSDIDIDLTETEAEYKMIPGWSIDKDPTVTVKAGSEACYLFVKLVKSDNLTLWQPTCKVSIPRAASSALICALISSCSACAASISCAASLYWLTSSNMLSMLIMFTTFLYCVCG